MPTVEELTWPFIGLSPEDLGHGYYKYSRYSKWASSVYSALYYILSAMLTVEELTWPFIGLSPEDLAHGNIPDIVSGHPLSIVLSIIFSVLCLQ